MNFKDFTKALNTLAPTACWALEGVDPSYEAINWQTTPVADRPTKADVLAEVKRIEEARAATEYQRLRAAEYPPVTDYLDAVVKGDQAAIDAYIEACLAIKDKYPKPV